MSEPQLRAEQLDPVALADVVAPRQWVHDLPHQIAARCDYVLELRESFDEGWTVTLFHSAGCPNPGELGITGFAGSDCTVSHIQTMEEAASILKRAQDELFCAGRNQLTVFAPFLSAGNDPAGPRLSRPRSWGCA